ncbi:MAG TPA: hypothetical protein VFJ58_00215 [Armatimonadota bacterium]|nr:hypothetical protein [Armatimonadota bacterium]
MSAEVNSSMVGDSRALELRSGSAALVRRPSTRFTTGLKLAGNGVVVVGGLAAWLPVIILPLLGVWAWGPFQLVTAMMVGTLWAIALTDNGSLCGNRRLREASLADLKARHPQLASNCIGFVGLSTHGHLLRQFQRFDTHEDVGSLCATPRSLIFLGDSIDLSIARAAITAIEFRIDPCCSFIGLHWIRLSYTDGDATRYLYLQSRDRDRLSDLPRRNNALLKRLQGWVGGSV